MVLYLDFVILLIVLRGRSALEAVLLRLKSVLWLWGSVFASCWFVRWFGILFLATFDFVSLFVRYVRHKQCQAM